MSNRIVTLAATAAIIALAAVPAMRLSPNAAAQQVTVIQKAHGFWPVGTTEARAWSIAQARDTIEVYEAFMRDFPTSPNFNAARDRRRVLLALRDAAKKSETGQDPNRDRGVVINPPVIIKPLPPTPPPPPSPPPPTSPPPPPPPVRPELPKTAPEIITKGPPIILKDAPKAPGEEMQTRTFKMEKGQDSAQAPSIDAPSPGPGPGAGPTRPGATTPRTVVTAVMTDLLPNMDRRAQNGGAAMVLLTTAPTQARRNQVLCDALYRHLTGATTDEIAVGVRRVDGVVQVLRPVYWFVRGNLLPTSVRNEGCPTRLANYHFARAGSVMRSLRLTGDGPFLAVVRTDDRAAGVIDLSRASDAEVEQWVLYFRDSFSKRDRIWSPQTNTPEQARRDLVAYFGESVVRALSTAPRVVFR